MNKKLLVTSMLALATATAAFARPHHHGPRGRDIVASVAGAVIGNAIGNIINPNPGYVVTPAPVVVPPAPVVVTPAPVVVPQPVIVAPVPPPGRIIGTKTPAVRNTSWGMPRGHWVDPGVRNTTWGTPRGTWIDPAMRNTSPAGHGSINIPANRNTGREGTGQTTKLPARRNLGNSR